MLDPKTIFRQCGIPASLHFIANEKDPPNFFTIPCTISKYLFSEAVMRSSDALNRLSDKGGNACQYVDVRITLVLYLRAHCDVARRIGQV